MPTWEDGVARGPSSEARAVHAERADDEPGKKSGCFDSMGCSRKKGKMVFAGSGNGEYEKVTDHVFVGDHEGAWRKDEVIIPYGWRLRKCSVCCIAVFTLLCIAGICLCVASLTSKGGEEVVEQGSPTPVEYDCDVDLDDWETAWYDRQKDYCCLTRGRGCPTTAKPNQFNCEDKRSSWETAWNSAKKDWCCGFSRTKCIEEEEAFDCGAGLVNWREGWSAAKKKWCCDHYSRGCSSPAWDCDIALDKWRTDWSEEKKDWCCDHEEKGCDDDSQGAHSAHHGETAKAQDGDDFDCDAGLDKWETGWTDDKKAWCCDHKKVHCQKSTSDYTGCKTVCVYHDWAATCLARIQWSSKHEAPDQASSKCKWAHKKVLEECDTCAGCDLVAAGCEKAPVTSDPYDCDAGYARWKDGWSPGKQAWCCLMHQKGCSDDSKTLYDCEAEVVSDWEPKKKEWCCEHKPELKGCEELKDQLFKCLDSQKAQWSEAEKLWCCARIGKGCEGVSAAPYNCEAGFATWWSAWSPSKTKFCCETKGKVCETPNCNEDFDSWEAKWSLAKKEWCCHQRGRGCVGAASVDSDDLDAAKG